MIAALLIAIALVASTPHKSCHYSAFPEFDTSGPSPVIYGISAKTTCTF